MDTVFDVEEDTDDVDTVCMVKILRVQVRPSDPASLEMETANDPALTKVMRFTREAGPAKDKTNVDDPAEKFRKIAISFPLPWVPLLQITSCDPCQTSK